MKQRVHFLRSNIHLNELAFYALANSIVVLMPDDVIVMPVAEDVEDLPQVNALVETGFRLIIAFVLAIHARRDVVREVRDVRQRVRLKR